MVVGIGRHGRQIMELMRKADGRSHTEPRLDLRIHVCAECCAVESGSDHNTFLVEMIDGNKIFDLFSTASAGKVEIVNRSSTEKLVLPVNTCDLGWIGIRNCRPVDLGYFVQIGCIFGC